MATALVQDFMTPNPITVKPTDSIATVVKLIEDHRVRGLPVVDDDGKVVGMISEGDLLVREAPLQAPLYLTFLGSVIYFESPESFHQHLKKSLSMLVQDVMTPHPTTTTPETPIADVAHLMVEKHIDRLPVIDAGQLVGIISRRDLIRALKPQLS